MVYVFFFFQAEDGIRDLVRSRGLGDVYKRQLRRIALMTGAADKAVSFFYAKLFSAALAPDFVSRLSLIHI